MKNEIYSDLKITQPVFFTKCEKLKEDGTRTDITSESICYGVPVFNNEEAYKLISGQWQITSDFYELLCTQGKMQFTKVHQELIYGGWVDGYGHSSPQRIVYREIAPIMEEK